MGKERDANIALLLLTVFARSNTKLRVGRFIAYRRRPILGTLTAKSLVCD